MEKILRIIAENIGRGSSSDDTDCSFEVLQLEITDILERNGDSTPRITRTFRKYYLYF